MKTLALLSFILFLSFQCYAQIDQQKLFYVQKAEKYRKMKNTGRFLTVAGGILFIVGNVTISKSTIIYNANGTTTTTGNPESGALAVLGGVAGLGAGIPLWIVGGHSQEKYENKLHGLSAKFNLSPQRTGITLTYRF